MNRRPHRILLSAFLLLALLSGSCSEDEDLEDNRSPVIHYLTSNRDTLFIPLVGHFNGLVTLTGAATDEDGDSLFWQWHGSHGSFPEGSSSHRIRWQAPPIARDYWIHVQVEDLRVAVRDSLRITVRAATPPTPDESPIARFKVYPAIGTRDTQFQFDASMSSDPETASKLLEVQWDFEGDGTWDTEWSLEKRTTHRYTQVGTYSIRLHVRDGSEGHSEVSREVQVEHFVPDLFIDEVLVPPGEFLMGPPGQEEPMVTDYSFLLGRTEVTNAQYLEALNWAYVQGLVTVTPNYVIRHGLELLWIGGLPYGSEIRFDQSQGRFILHAGNHTEGAFGPGLAFPDGYDPAEHPVKNVTWFGAAQYCDWLSAMNGLPLYYRGNFYLPGTFGTGYRLPYLAEWEYAARYPDQRTYPWGNEEPDCSRAEYNPGPPCTGWTSPAGTHPAGASELGLQDMAGNVQEWTNLIVNEFWYNQEMDLSGAVDYTWCMGGSMQSVSSSLRCYNRLYLHASFTMNYRFFNFYPDIGFRVCRRVP